MIYLFLPGPSNNAFLPWIKDVFKEEAALPDGDTALLNPEEEWPSDDPEDDDYNPDRREDTHSINAVGTDDNPSDSSSSTSLWSLNGEYSPVDEGVSHEYLSVNSCIDSDGSGEVACGRRQRKAVDYKKLYDVSIKLLIQHNHIKVLKVKLTTFAVWNSQATDLRLIAQKFKALFMNWIGMYM